MLRSGRKLLLLLAIGLPIAIVASALLYMVGMAELEERPRTFWQALEWAAETISTTGYGADTEWRHPGMVLFVVVLQFLGVFLLFLIIPIYLIPVLEERFEARLPTRSEGLEDHVVVYRYGPAVETLLEELEREGVDTLVMEPDESTARPLFDAGQPLIRAGLEDGGLERAGLASARCLIANGADDENVAIILAARQLGFTGEILALAESPEHQRPIRLAGATDALTPRHVLGEVLADRASRRVGPAVAGLQQLGRHLSVGEVRIDRRSSLAGKTLAEAGVASRTGVQVIGQWKGGQLETAVSSDMRLLPGGILVLVGTSEALAAFEAECHGSVALPRQGPVVVAGCGVVGRKVSELLLAAGEEVIGIDADPESGAKIVGDALDAEALEQAQLDRAQGVVLALDSDSSTLFATVLIRDLSPTVPLIARVNRSENVERIHLAGADFALSFSQVAGQILAARLLGEEAILIGPRLKIRKVKVRGLEGKPRSRSEIRERTGCTVVAVERGEELLVELDQDFRFEPGDLVYIGGSAAAIRRYTELFPGAA